ncbi:MAG: GntR family transcriptional regulator [Rhodobacter sp.]|nr:GntR family transcriptional regulator [Rhodobacter sp.]
MTRSAPTTWQTVRDEVLRRINARDWAPGEAIPNEADLAREFGCARATVNRALRALADAGLVERRRKAGTRVALNPVRRAVLHIPLIRDEIAAAGLRYGYRLVEAAQRIPPKAIRDGFSLGQTAPALRISALHLGGGAPFVVEDRWVNLAAAPGIAEADLDTTSANEWLLQNTPFHGGAIAISAVNADARLAHLLGCETDAALVCLDRETWDELRKITVARLTYRPGHRVLSTF